VVAPEPNAVWKSVPVSALPLRVRVRAAIHFSIASASWARTRVATGDRAELLLAPCGCNEIGFEGLGECSVPFELEVRDDPAGPRKGAPGGPGFDGEDAVVDRDE
jgi:hypothetical protein